MNDVEIMLERENEYTIDDDGNEVAGIVTSTVLGEKKSTTSAEFMNAGKLGLKAHCMVEIYVAEYEGEKTAILDGQRLSIYRTFVKGDRIELHLAERTGNE